jgi:hypothetical protein
VQEAEQILRQKQATLPPSNPQAPSLWQQVRGVTVKSALSTAPRALGTIGLAVGVAELSWKVGTGINAKFLKVGIPEATDAPQNYRWNRIVWTPALQHEYNGARWPAADGWLIWMRQTCCWYFDMERWFEEPCRFSGFEPPAPSTVHDPVQSTAQCVAPTPSGYADVRVLYGWAPENALGAPGPNRALHQPALQLLEPRANRAAASDRRRVDRERARQTRKRPAAAMAQLSGPTVARPSRYSASRAVAESHGSH